LCSCSQTAGKSRAPALGPTVCGFREPWTLYSYDAESLSGRSFHDHPSLQSADHARTQLLQATDFSGDVVGFDVYMHPTLMVNTLNLHDRLIGWCFQHSVGAPRPGMRRIYRASQRLGPKGGCLIDIGCIAVDQKRTQTGMMQGSCPQGIDAQSLFSPTSPDQKYFVLRYFVALENGTRAGTCRQ